MSDPWHDASSDMPLAEFPRRHRPAATPLSSRVIAGLLTAALSALLVLLATQESFWTMPDRPASSHIITVLIRDEPHKKIVMLPPPFVTRFIRLRVEKPAPPVFTVASETAPAPALLPASAAQSSPLAGGVMTAMGTGPQSVSGNGIDGNGAALSGCFDSAWARSVTEHIGHFFFYPVRARQDHATGVVMVHLMVRRNGRLARLDILQSSGNAFLDKAATQIVRNAAPLPRIPYRMHVDQVDAKMLIGFGAMGDDHPTADSCGR